MFEIFLNLTFTSLLFIRQFSKFQGNTSENGTYDSENWMCYV